MPIATPIQSGKDKPCSEKLRLTALAKIDSMLIISIQTKRSVGRIVMQPQAIMQPTADTPERRAFYTKPRPILNHVRFESGSSRWVGEAARIPI